jgi:hypothetical protein
MKWQGIEEDYIARSLMLFTLTNYLSGDPIKNNEMGCACDTCGAQERCVQNFFLEGGDLKEEDHLLNLGVDRRLMLQ